MIDHKTTAAEKIAEGLRDAIAGRVVSHEPASRDTQAGLSLTGETQHQSTVLEEIAAERRRQVEGAGK